MAPPAIPESEFIELWRTYGSAAAVAKALGMAVRAVHNRRRSIEKRKGITLEARAQTARHYKHLHPVEHAARRTLTLEAGKVLVFSDAHFWPGVRTTAFRALVQFIRQIKPDVIVNNGDAFDGAGISRFPRIGWQGSPTILDELKACKERLGEIEEVAGSARLFWALGNHDTRFESRLANNVPQYEGVFGLRLQDHFPAWAPCWSVWVNDSVVIKHRMKGGIHATHNNTINSGKSIVTGHLHSLKVTPFDDYAGTRWGVDTGTLADPRGPQFVDYLEDNPTNWRSGFILLTIQRGQLLWPEVIRVVDGHHVDFRGALVKVDP